MNIFIAISSFLIKQLIRVVYVIITNLQKKNSIIFSKIQKQQVSITSYLTYQKKLSKQTAWNISFQSFNIQNLKSKNRGEIRRTISPLSLHWNSNCNSNVIKQQLDTNPQLEEILIPQCLTIRINWRILISTLLEDKRRRGKIDGWRGETGISWRGQKAGNAWAWPVTMCISSRQIRLIRE